MNSPDFLDDIPVFVRRPAGEEQPAAAPEPMPAPATRKLNLHDYGLKWITVAEGTP